VSFSDLTDPTYYHINQTSALAAATGAAAAAAAASRRQPVLCDLAELPRLPDFKIKIGPDDNERLLDFRLGLLSQRQLEKA
jgi:hypothetical protein